MCKVDTFCHCICLPILRFGRWFIDWEEDYEVYDHKYKLYILLLLVFMASRLSVALFLLFMKKIRCFYIVISHKNHLQTKIVFLRGRRRIYLLYYGTKHRNIRSLWKLKQFPQNYVCFYILYYGTDRRLNYIRVHVCSMKRAPMLVLKLKMPKIKLNKSHCISSSIQKMVCEKLFCENLIKL